jgi:tripeptidyl-peptidase-1
MSRITCLTLLFCTFFLSGECLPSRAVVHDKRAAIPAGFASQGASSPDEDIVLSFNIASRDRDGLEAKLLAASTPGSSTFRQWLSKSEVESHAAPSSEALEAVHEWLSSNDINVPASNSEPSNWLSVNVPISKANKLLSTTFEKFEHIPTHKNLNRVMQYSVPSNLAGVIKAVYPTTSFDVFDEPSPNESLNADAPTSVSSTTPAKRQELCDMPIKPSCLLDLYKVPRSANISTQSRIGIASLFLRNVSTASFPLLTAFLHC